jgi:hypothetical protein
MITDSNQACFAKMTGRRLQEVLNEISFSRFLEQIDSKIWGLHLQIDNTRTPSPGLYLFAMKNTVLRTRKYGFDLIPFSSASEYPIFEM